MTAAPAEPAAPQGQFARLFAWVRRRSGLVAGLVGLYAVYRALRGLAVFGWLFRDLLPLGDAADWAGDHPWAVVAGCVVVFAAAAGAARVVIGWLGRRADRKAGTGPRPGEAAPATPPAPVAPPTPTPAPGSLTPGDPLARS